MPSHALIVSLCHALNETCLAQHLHTCNDNLCLLAILMLQRQPLLTSDTLQNETCFLTMPHVASATILASHIQPSMFVSKLYSNGVGMT